MRVLVRDLLPDSQWSRMGIEQVSGDLNAPESLAAAFRGVEKFFSVSPFGENLAQLGLNSIEAAKRSGVKYIVRSSAMGADADGALTSSSTARASGKGPGGIRDSIYRAPPQRVHAELSRPGSHYQSARRVLPPPRKRQNKLMSIRATSPQSRCVLLLSRATKEKRIRSRAPNQSPIQRSRRKCHSS